MITLVLTLLISLSARALEADMRPFTTDGCTLSPDGTPRRPKLWRHCCVAHDLRLWGGGGKPAHVDADKKLKACVASVAGKRTAEIFFAGVRIGKLSPWKIPSMRWGNAWPGRAPYRQLSPLEIQLLIDQLDDLAISPEIREAYRQELTDRLPH